MKSSKKLVGFIAMVLFFIMATSILFGQDTAKVVFGPKTYTRETGKPETVTDTFSVTNPAGQFTVYVQNGDSKKTKVSSGSVVINNVEVVSESEFNKQAEKIEKPLTGIQKDNTIKVTLRSKPGSFLIVKITGTEQYVQPTLIWQKEFSAKITDVSPTFPLKYVVTKDTIKFLDEDGNIKKEISLKYVEGDDLASARVLPSKQGRYIMILTPLEVSNGEEGKGRDILKSKYTFMNDVGEVLWEKDGFEGTNLAVNILPSDTGQSLFSSGFWEGDFHFYDSGGNLIKKVTPVETDILSGYGEFSTDGNYYIDNIQEPSVLVCFTKTGDEVWRYNLGNSGGEMSVSPDDKYIAAFSEKEGINNLYLFDMNGDLMWSKNTGGGRIAFSSEGEYLGITAGVKVSFFETLTGNLLWTYRGSNIRYREIEVFSNGEYVIVSAITYNPPRDNKGVVLGPPSSDGARYVYLFDKTGNKIWEKEFSGAGYTSWDETPRVLISEDGSKLVIAEKKGLFYYTLK